MRHIILYETFSESSVIGPDDLDKDIFDIAGEFGLESPLEEQLASHIIKRFSLTTKSSKGIDFESDHGFWYKTEGMALNGIKDKQSSTTFTISIKLRTSGDDVNRHPLHDKLNKLFNVDAKQITISFLRVQSISNKIKVEVEFHYKHKGFHKYSYFSTRAITNKEALPATLQAAKSALDDIEHGKMNMFNNSGGPELKRVEE